MSGPKKSLNSNVVLPGFQEAFADVISRFPLPSAGDRRSTASLSEYSNVRAPKERVDRPGHPHAPHPLPRSQVASCSVPMPLAPRASQSEHLSVTESFDSRTFYPDITHRAYRTDVPPSPPVSGRQTGHRCNSSLSAAAPQDTQPPSTSSPSQYRDSASASPVASSTRSDGDDEEFPELVGFQNLRRRKRHICPVCNKDFLRPSSLETHMNSHTGARPHKCTFPDCDKYFSAKSNMKRHLRNHFPPDNYLETQFIHMR